MLVLFCYGLILHLISFVVLHVKYTVLKGKLQPVEEALPVGKPRTSAPAENDTGSTQSSTAVPAKSTSSTAAPKIVPTAAPGTMDVEIEC